jgi:Pectinacetylesterase
VLVVLLLCGAAACSASGPGSGSGPAAGPASSAAPQAQGSQAQGSQAQDSPAQGSTASPAPSTTQAVAAEWQQVSAPDNCKCSDGSPYSYWVREGDPAKVMFFLQGGGACFDADSCAATSKAYKHTTDAGDNPSSRNGIFDATHPDNPLADYSIVFVPYCTGDVHIGNAETVYSDSVTVHHNGYVNASTALNDMAARFPGAQHVFVAGESAGAVPTPLFAALAADLLPEARLTVLADGSGAYPDVPGVNAAIGGAWGTSNAIPDWPENEGLTVDDWSFPDLFVQAHRHAPDITFARHDYAFDRVQMFFAGLAGLPKDDLVSLIDANETQIEGGGAELHSYIAPGDDHTVLSKSDVYTESVNGERFIDWLSALVNEQPVDDVHCVECGG